MKRIYDFLIYLGVRIVWFIVNLIPARCAYNLGASVGRFFFFCLGGRKSVATDNILAAGLAANRKEALRLARESVAHFIGHILEGLKVPVFMTPEHMAANITLEMPDETMALLKDPQRSLLVLTPHLGCWEVGLALMTSYKPAMVLASTFTNPWVQRFGEKHFRGGVEVFPKKYGVTMNLIRRWKEGRALVLAVDQHAGRHGIWIDFLGRQASTHTSPARLHLHTGFPIVIGAFLRTGTLRYHVVASKPLVFARTADRERDTIAILREINRQFEEMIRLAPEQYLWAHRRWRPKRARDTRRY